MPDLIGHFGAQGIASRSIWRRAPVPWILLGATLPDVPWISQRIVHEAPFLDAYLLRLYFIVQASLFGCLLLAGALALLTARPRSVFLLIGLNAALHLALDACQTKWANGVHFIAPFSWHAINLEWFWPESLPNYFLQGLGLVFLLAVWRTGVPAVRRAGWPSRGRLAAAGLCAAAYLAAPIAFLQSPGLRANAFVDTLQDYGARTGRPVEFDRNVIESNGRRTFVTAINDEEIDLVGANLPRNGLVSMRGVFLDRHTVRVDEVHVHSRGLRDAASYIGLGFLLLYWLRWALRPPETALSA